MTRRITKRLIFTGILETTAPVHVGGAFEDAETDLPLAKNGKGEFYIPGTSIAGVVRSWFRNAYGEDAEREVFGHTPKKNGDDEGFASFLLIEDAILQGTARPEIRDGVGIDRFSGAAAENIKHDRQVLPRGSHFSFCMTLEIPEKILEKNADADTWRGRIAHLVQAMIDGKLRLGGAKTRGLGRFRLTDVQVREDALLNKRGMLDLLDNLSKGETGKPFDLKVFDPNGACPPREPDILTILIHWRPDGPLMVKADADGLAVDMLPLFTDNGSNDELVRLIPGSSIKGALRNMAERIMNTLMERDVEQNDFLAQLDADPLVQTLFGSRGKNKKEKEKDAKMPSWAGLAALGVEDCHCTDDTISRQQWQDMLRAEDMAELRNLYPPSRAGHWQPAMHVAIDRFTGGASDKALYSVLEVFGGEWEPIELRLDLDRLQDETFRQAALALLFLTLRELAQGRIPLGFSTHRGMGAVQVEEITFDGDFPLEKIIPDDFENPAKLAGLKELNEAWHHYLKKTHSQVQGT